MSSSGQTDDTTLEHSSTHKCTAMARCSGSIFTLGLEHNLKIHTRVTCLPTSFRAKDTFKRAMATRMKANLAMLSSTEKEPTTGQTLVSSTKASLGMGSSMDMACFTTQMECMRANSDGV